MNESAYLSDSRASSVSSKRGLAAEVAVPVARHERNSALLAMWKGARNFQGLLSTKEIGGSKQRPNMGRYGAVVIAI